MKRHLVDSASRFGRVERFFLGLLFILFMATEIGGALLPSPRLDFVERVSPNPEPDNSGSTRAELPTPLRITIVPASTSRRLRGLFHDARYDLDSVRTGWTEAPTLFLATLPKDLAAIARVRDRKDLFVRIVLPLILHRNAIILEQRRGIQKLDYQTVADIAPRDRAWLLRLARRYRVLAPEAGIDELNEPARLELLRRVDLIPVSLALAQSAAESGWGTSRFAQRGNALFGQWTWQQDAGIVPLHRDAGRDHRVRAFPRLASSVRAYARNLNTSDHYTAFRAARSALRRRGGTPDGRWGYRLASHLGAYSEEGAEYIRKIRLIIRANGFGDFETARLAKQAISRPPVMPGS